MLHWRGNKYYIFWVCVCSLRYPSCNAHAPYCYPRPASLYNIFHFTSKNGMNFEKKKTTPLFTKCVFWFPLKLLSQTFLVLRRNMPDMLRHVGTAVAQWLRCCATNRKVAGSIPAGVSVFFIDIKSFRSHYGPGVDSASNRNEYQHYFLGVKSGRCVRLTTIPPSCAVVTQSGNLNFLEPSGPLQACNGTALPLCYDTWSALYSCPILMKFEYSRQFFLGKKNQISWKYVKLNGRTNLTKLFAFLRRGLKSEHVHGVYTSTHKTIILYDVHFLSKLINPLKTKRRPLYLKTQSVPRCKHFSSRL